MSNRAANSGRPRSERSRRAILDAAAALLTNRGYADVTIEGIAAEAGVGKATIYRWWSSKAAIYMDVYAELAARITPPADTGDVAEDLRLLLRGAFRLYRETAAGLALAGIVAEAQVNADVSRTVRTEFAPSRVRIVTALLRRGLERGQISRGVDIQLLGEAIAGASWYGVLVGSRALTDKHAIRLTDCLLLGAMSEGVQLRTRRRTGVWRGRTGRRRGRIVAASAERRRATADP